MVSQKCSYFFLNNSHKNEPNPIVITCGIHHFEEIWHKQLKNVTNITV